MISLTSPGFRSVGFRDIRAGALQPVAGAIAWYRCDEGAGQILHDYSGNGNHGTLGSTSGVDTNDPAWNAQGLVFGGDDWAVLGIPNRLFASPNSPFTVQITHDYFSNGTILARCGGGASSTRTFQFLVSALNTISIILRGGSTEVYTSNIPGPTCTTIVFDGTSASVFKNGIFLKPCAVGTAAEETTEQILVGARTSASPVGAGSGGIYGIKISPYATSPSQIAQDYTYIKSELLKKQVFLP